MHEHDCRALSHIDSVDPVSAVNRYPTLVLAPIDIQPLRASLWAIGLSLLASVESAYAAHL